MVNEKYAKVIAFANQKGGVSKTTSCQMLACGLAENGKKVLTIDADAQRNLTSALARNLIHDAKYQEKTVYEVMEKKCTVEECLVSVNENLDILPGSEIMAAADMKFTGPGREYHLSEALKSIKNCYDYILIDTPPQLGITSLNAMVCATGIIVPMWATKFSIQGFQLLMDTISTVRNYYNPALRIEGVLITQYSNRGEMQSLIKEHLGDLLGSRGIYLFQSSIRTGNAIQRAQNEGVNPFTEKDRKYSQSGAIKDYKAFVAEYLERESKS